MHGQCTAVACTLARPRAAWRSPICRRRTSGTFLVLLRIHDVKEPVRAMLCRSLAVCTHQHLSCMRPLHRSLGAPYRSLSQNPANPAVSLHNAAMDCVSAWLCYISIADAIAHHQYLLDTQPQLQTHDNPSQTVKHPAVWLSYPTAHSWKIPKLSARYDIRTCCTPKLRKIKNAHPCPEHRPSRQRLARYRESTAGFSCPMQ